MELEVKIVLLSFWTSCDTGGKSHTLNKNRSVQFWKIRHQYKNKLDERLESTSSNTLQAVPYLTETCSWLVIGLTCCVRNKV